MKTTFRTYLLLTNLTVKYLHRPILICLLINALMYCCPWRKSCGLHRFLTILANRLSSASSAQTLDSGKRTVSWADEDSSGLMTSVVLLIYRIKYFCQPATAPTCRATIQVLQTDSFMLQNLRADDGLFPELMTSWLQHWRLHRLNYQAIFGSNETIYVL